MSPHYVTLYIPQLHVLLQRLPFITVIIHLTQEKDQVGRDNIVG